MDGESEIGRLLSSSILLIDKPCGPTSHEVAAHVRRLLGAKRAGHTGTLDPAVSGLLLVGINRATRFLHYISRLEKEYIGMIKFHKRLSEEEVKALFKKFTGEITQMPPKESAVRKAPRKRRIYLFELLEMRGHSVLFRVRCQAGTYIRTLCADMGKLCGGAHMCELRRIAVGDFGVECARTLQQLSDAAWLFRERGNFGALSKILLPPESFLRGYKKIVIKGSACKNIISGAPLSAPGVLQIEEGIKKGETVALMMETGRLAAMAVCAQPSEKIGLMKHGEVAFPKYVAIREEDLKSIKS